MFNTEGYSDEINMRIEEVERLSYNDKLRLGLGKANYDKYLSLSPVERSRFLRNCLYKDESLLPKMADVFLPTRA